MSTAEPTATCRGRRASFGIESNDLVTFAIELVLIPRQGSAGEEIGGGPILCAWNVEALKTLACRDEAIPAARAKSEPMT